MAVFSKFLDHLERYLCISSTCTVAMGNAIMSSEKIAQNLKRPTNTLIGKLVNNRMVKNNTFLEREAVRLCDVQSHHHVMEVGFGPGVGLKAVYDIIKDGSGKVTGVDYSSTMASQAAKEFRKEIASGKIDILCCNVTSIPCNANTFDRIFHVNCYYFWPDALGAAMELHRVLKPNSMMVTTLVLSRLQKRITDGSMRYGNIDPIRYMTALEHAGFTNVHIKYHEADVGLEYQAIYSTSASEEFPHDFDQNKTNSDRKPSS